jgi:uncharacterized protein (DUF952 family)
MERWLYKIVRPAEHEALTTLRRWPGSADDVRDGFVHLSTAGQVQGTLDRHFAGEALVHVLLVDAAKLPAAALRWEASRGGALFPHLYAPLEVDAVHAEAELTADPSGRLCFRELA